MILNLKSRVAYVLAVVLVVLLGITQVAPAYAGTESGTDGQEFVIENGVLKSYTGTDSKVTIPDTVTEIGENALKNSTCTSVTIPNSVTKIGKNAFFNSQITEIDIPSSVKTIDSMAFYAARIKTVTFHEGLESIGYGAFGEVYFPAGTTIEIPASVSSIGGDAFDSLGLSKNESSAIKVKGKDTTLGSGFVAYYNNVKVYGHKNSTADTYVSSLKTSKGDKCTLEFVDIDSALDIAVESVTVTPKNIGLSTGGETTLSAKVLPENATNKKITWSSSDNNIATVDQNGKVTAAAAGTAKITAAAGDKTGECVVTVSDPDDFEITDGVLTAYNGSDTKVIIPSGVKEIAANAFSKGTKITELTVPEGVTKIATKAFYGMNALETLNLPASLTTAGGSEESWFGKLFVSVSNTGTPQGIPVKLASINVAEGGKTYSSKDGVVYSADGTTLLYCPAEKTSISFDKNTTTFGKYAFYKSKINSMELPEKLETIGDAAFYSSSVKYLKFPDTVRKIGKNAFFNAAIQSVSLNEGLETIGGHAFSAAHIGGITIPASVKSIGEWNFDYDYGTDKYIVIKGSDTTIGTSAIPSWYAVDVYAPSGSKAEEYVNNAKASGSSKLKFHPIDEFVAATELKISDSSLTLSRQEEKALLASANPEGSHMPIVSWSSSDTKVATVNSKGTVTGVQPGTAVITARAGDLTAQCQIKVVKEAEESDFTISKDGLITGYLGTDMSRLQIPEEVNGTKVKGIAEGAFKDQTAIKEVVLPNVSMSIEKEAFRGCTNLTAVNFDKVTKMGEAAFAETGLKSIKLGEGLTSIPKKAFLSCRALTDVILSKTVESIGESAFSNCKALTKITLNEGLKTIGQEALYMTHISTLHLPSTFEDMGGSYMGDVFEVAGKSPADTAMKTITVSDDNPLYSSHDGILYNKNATKVVFCPRGVTSAKVLDGVTEIGDMAFFMCFDLESVKLPDTLKVVGKGAFQYDEALTECELPKGLETVKDSAFFGAENWTGVDRIPSTVKTIGAYGFAECKGSKLTIPEGITKIEEFSFWGYEEGLEEINLPSTLKIIGNSAFSWAKDVKKLVIPEGVTSIGAEAFARLDSLESLTLPSMLQEIGSKAFMGKEGSNMLKSVYIPSSVTSIADDAFLNREDTVIMTDSKDSAAAAFAEANGFELKIVSNPEPVNPDKSEKPSSGSDLNHGNGADKNSAGQSTGKAADKSVSTGDSTDLALWIALMLAGTAGLAGTAAYGRRRKMNR